MFRYVGVLLVAGCVEGSLSGDGGVLVTATVDASRIDASAINDAGILVGDGGVRDAAAADVDAGVVCAAPVQCFHNEPCADPDAGYDDFFPLIRCHRDGCGSMCRQFCAQGLGGYQLGSTTPGGIEIAVEINKWRGPDGGCNREDCYHPLSLSGGPEGSPCTNTIDCFPVCCTCPTGTRAVRVCSGGKCLGADVACDPTKICRTE